MYLQNGGLRLSATDLANFLACRHRTALDMAVEAKLRSAPEKETDALLDLLAKRGLAHEAEYVRWLADQGLSVTDLSDVKDADQLVAATIRAMEAGTDVVFQGALRDGQWFGKPDILRRIERASRFGSWSYEVYDTKLSRTTKAGAILQLSLYSAMLAKVQDFQPTRFFVVTPRPVLGKPAPDALSKEVKGPDSMSVLEYRVNDYAAYFRLVRRRMEETVVRDAIAVAEENYPDPVDHCAICRWRQTCAAKRVADDHISRVAGISRMQRRELERLGITTRRQCGEIWPLPAAPRRGSLETYEAFHLQAKLQLQSTDEEIAWELRPIVAYRPATETEPLQLDEGLCCLPEPSPGDIFLDFEGDPYAVEGGREYLTGIVTVDTGKPVSEGIWGFSDQDERAAFERLMDMIAERRAKWPGMHVYHYAPYEITALRKLRLRYESRGEALDRFLSEHVFVDLYAVVRQGVRAGVESYSIKKLEPLYGFTRKVELDDATAHRNAIEVALQLGQRPDEETQSIVLGYNEDDCVSTWKLRQWLEMIRGEHNARHPERSEGPALLIPRPTWPPEPEVKPNEHQQLVDALRARLLPGIPTLAEERVTAEQRATWTLAHLLDYHRREYLATVWEYWRLRELPEEKLLDEPQAILGLKFVGRVGENVDRNGKKTGKVTDRYTWPQQEMEIEKGDLKLRDGGTLGEIVDLDRLARTVDVLKSKKQRNNHPRAVFSFTYVPTRAHEKSLLAIGERAAAEGGLHIEEGASDLAARRLLLGVPPVLRGNALGEPEKEIVQHLTDAVLRLDHSVLPVQGPPGSGKTYAGARAICALVAAGKTVGVTGTSHAVIRNLLREVAKASSGAFPIAQKCDEGDFKDDSGIIAVDDNDAAREMLDSGEARVLGATSWLWAREQMARSVSHLFVDEAGQIALANVIAMSPCCESIVLLGDPQQLEQPTRASHPDRVGCSSLEYALDGKLTVSADRGVFLPKTWRMAPSITLYTSEMFYEDRLSSVEGLENQVIAGTEAYGGSGLRASFVEHDGNRSYSTEEVEALTQTVAHLTAGGVTWTDRHGAPRPVTGKEIVVVAPYNSQVSRLQAALTGTGVRAGTVDRFQGQEAPVVIYSMASSRAEDAPRGMEFLYNLNRLNVATSRAKCLAVVLASRALFEPECRTPRQIKLTNALCRYRELSSLQPSREFTMKRYSDSPTE